MSYTESQLWLTEADAALAQGECRQAADSYAAVVAGTLSQADALRPLTPAATALVAHYATASRGQSAALLRLGETAPAEAALLTALARLRGCLHNLGTPVAQRAPLLTQYKLCFYALAELYCAQQQVAKLGRYARRHTPELTRWAADLYLTRAAPATN